MNILRLNKVYHLLLPANYQQETTKTQIERPRSNRAMMLVD